MEKKNLDAIKALIKQTEKKYGSGTLTFGSTGFKTLPRTTSGSINLDMILGGGLPEGRIYEIYGPESCGKTSIALMMVSNMQKVGKVCAYVDVEQALDPSWMRKLGVNVDELLLAQPECGEDALDLTEQLVNSGVVDFIVVDSVAALTPRAELEGEMSDLNVGLQARLMSKAMRKLVSSTAKMKCSILFINQLREKIGVMFGNPETTTGGKALKYYASIRMDARKELIKQGTENVGQKIKIKTVKNKTYPPLKTAEVTLMYETGFDVNREILQKAVDFEIINKSGAWYSYGSTKIGQGENAALNFILSEPGLFDEIKAKVLENVSKSTSVNNTVDDVDNIPEMDEDFD